MTAAQTTANAKLRSGRAKAAPKQPVKEAAKDVKAPAKAAEEKVAHREELLKVVKQPEKPFRAKCARAMWWERFQAYNGKTLSELQASCEQDPPSVPQKGNSAGKVEAFGGWMSFFKGEGLVVAVEAKK